MTAQDAAVVTVACIALERSETFTVVRVAAESGKGQPPPAVVGWEGWRDEPLQLPSISVDLSVVTVITGANSQVERRAVPLKGASPTPCPYPCKLQSEPGVGMLLFSSVGCCSSLCRKILLLIMWH